MDEPFLLSNFIDLQEIDNEIYKIEAQKGESDDVILLKELELQYKKANTELDESKTVSYTHLPLPTILLV